MFAIQHNVDLMIYREQAQLFLIPAVLNWDTLAQMFKTPKSKLLGLCIGFRHRLYA